MGQSLNPDAIERDRKKKRITIPLSSRDAAAVTRISALRGFPSSRVVAYMIGKGMEIEQTRRLCLDRPKWPAHPTDPRYVQAAFGAFDFLDLVELAETAFEPLTVTAAALFQLGLDDFQKKQHPAGKMEFNFG